MFFAAKKPPVWKIANFKKNDIMFIYGVERGKEN